MTKSSGVSVELTTFNFIKLGFVRDKEKDMTDIPADTWRRYDVALAVSGRVHLYVMYIITTIPVSADILFR